MSDTSLILLLDLESSFPDAGLAKIETLLARASRVVACYAQGEPKVPLRLVRALAAGLAAGRVEVVAMLKCGRNAADFGLTFWAGRMLAESPPDAEFVIVSADSDLDHAVALLEAAGRKAHREGGRTSALPADTARPPAVMALEYIAKLRREASRPASARTLRNSIDAHFTGKQFNMDLVIEELQAKGWVSVDEHGRVTYPDPVSASAEEDCPADCADTDGVPF